MKLHRKGKMTVCRAGLVGFMGQSVSGSKQSVFPTGPETHWVPQRHLSLTHATEAGGEDPPVGHKDGPDRSEAFMRLLLLLEIEQKSNIRSWNKPDTS